MPKSGPTQNNLAQQGISSTGGDHTCGKCGSMKGSSHKCK